MPIFRNRIRRSRRERMRRTDRFFEHAAYLLLVAYLIFVLAAWLSYREKFRISEIRVEGTRAVDALMVRSLAESQLARHLLWKIDMNNPLLYPKGATISAIKDLDTRVKTVDIGVEGGKVLVVRLNEYSPVFLWCPPDSGSATTTLMSDCYFADDMGHIFSPAPDYSGNPFVIFVTTMSEGSGNPLSVATLILPEGEFSRVNVFLGKLEVLGVSPRVVVQSGAHDFTISTDKSWEIRWSSTRDPEEDARNLSLVLQNLRKDPTALETLKAIDLRFGNKVFYR